MPMNWTPAADQKLLLAIIGQCNVKISTEDYAALATVMGPDCTPKAIKMRMSKIRANAATVGENGAEAAADEDVAAPKKKKKSAAAAAKKGGNNGGEKKSVKKRKLALVEEGEDEELKGEEDGEQEDGGQKVKVEEMEEGEAAAEDWELA